jgi:hypothetical protein
MARFKTVPKEKGSGLPKKYVSGSKNKSATRSEIKRTRRRYRMGLLSPAEMDRISKQRSKT